MKKSFLVAAALLSLTLFSSMKLESSSAQNYYWMKIKATDKFQRSTVSATGAAIEIVKEDYVIAYGNDVEKNRIEKLGWLVASSNLALEEDYPAKDAAYHNYAELTQALQKLQTENPDLVKLTSIAKTTENKDIWALQITANFQNADQKPAAIFMAITHVNIYQ
jgi:carboxypeptidase T